MSYRANSLRIGERWRTDRAARANPVAMVAMLGGKVSVLGPLAVLFDLGVLALVYALGALFARHA